MYLPIYKSSRLIVGLLLFVTTVFVSPFASLASTPRHVWKSFQGRAVSAFRIPIAFNVPPTLAVTEDGVYFAIPGDASSKIFIINRENQMQSLSVSVPSLGDAFTWRRRACFVRFYTNSFYCFTKGHTLENIKLQYKGNLSNPQITRAFSDGAELYLVDSANKGVAHYSKSDSLFFKVSGAITSIAIYKKLAFVASFGYPISVFDGLSVRAIKTSAHKVVSLAYLDNRLVFVDFLTTRLSTVDRGGLLKSYRTESVPESLSLQGKTDLWFTGRRGVDLTIGFFDGKHIQEFVLPASLDPEASISVEKNGTIWLSDRRTHSIVKLSPGGV